MSSVCSARFIPWDGYAFFFFNDTATTEIYTLSLHDALPISPPGGGRPAPSSAAAARAAWCSRSPPPRRKGRGCGCSRSEEHTSELQSRQYLVCRLLLEKKKQCQDQPDKRVTLGELISNVLYA